MAIPSSQKPFLEHGWLRVVCFLLFYFGCIVFATLLMQKFLPAAKPDGAASTSSLYIFILISSVFFVLLVVIFRKFVDRKSFASLGFVWNGFAAHSASGFFVGMAILLLGSFILSIGGYLQYTGIQFNANSIFLSFGLMVIVAFTEELVFRGYILSNLLQSMQPYMALLVSAFVFAVFHSGNPNAELLPIINVFLAGILLGINYIYTKNLWFALALHFIWNFLQGPILGFKVSGLASGSLLQQELSGNELITGGAFGFEGSLLATVLISVCIVVLAVVYQKKSSSVVIAN